MEPNDAIDLGRGAISIALTVGGPILLVGMAAGLLIGLLQALTQVQDQTVSFVPKLVAMVGVLGLMFPWLMQMMVEYTDTVIREIPQRLLGG